MTRGLSDEERDAFDRSLQYRPTPDKAWKKDSPPPGWSEEEMAESAAGFASMMSRGR